MNTRFWYGSERGAHWRSPVDGSWLISLGYRAPLKGVTQWSLPRKGRRRKITPRCLWCLHADSEMTAARLVGVPLNRREGGWQDIVATYEDHGTVPEARWKQLITPEIYEQVKTLPAFRWMRLHLPTAAALALDAREEAGQGVLFGGAA